MRTSLLLLTACLSTALFAQSPVEEIVTKHQRGMLDELVEYLEKNPKAEDREMARQEAVQAAAQLGENELVVNLLIEAVEESLAQEVVPVQDAAQIGMMAAQFASSNGMKPQVQAIYNMLKDHPEVQQSPMFINAENALKQMLQLPGIGDKPELTGMTVNGKKLDLADYQGQVVLLDFWATWCPPCMAELPTMLATYEKYHAKGFEIIGVSADRNKGALTGVMDQKGITWPNLYDSEQDASLVEKFNIQAFPTLLLLDQTGTVVAMNTRGHELEKAVAKLLDGKND